jgi:hypothetical protein
MRVDNLTLAWREIFLSIPQCLLKAVNIDYREEIFLYKKDMERQIGDIIDS